MKLYRFETPTPGFGITINGNIISFENDGTSMQRGYYTTANEQVAVDIRNSNFFQNGTIKEKTIAPAPASPEKKQPVAAPAKVAAEEKADDNVVVYPDVTKTQEAISILRSKHGVTASMRTRVDMLDAAGAVGVSFPNIK